MNLKKQGLTYLIVSLGLVAFNYFYSLFSHGVSSDAMSGMWRYPVLMALVSGVVSLFITDDLMKEIRLGAFTINCGVTAIISSLILTGIVEIAGTNSAAIPYFYYGGWFFVITGLIIGSFQLIVKSKQHQLN